MDAGRMKAVWRLAALMVMLVALVPVQPLAAQGEDTEDPIAEIDTILNRMVDDDNFSGSVLIARGDEVLLSRGYGLANREWRAANTPQTKFRIHKLTMQFTGMAILMLQERGLLSVDEPICQYLEDCPESWQDITIYHLLTHSAGLNVVPQSRDFDYALGNRRTALNLFRQEPLYFAPGEAMSWSDAGYWLLGEIIGEVHDGTYIDFLRENIFEPLGMNDTNYDRLDWIVPQRAEGYTRGFLRQSGLTNMQVPYAAGGLYSTVEDLYRWEQALFNGGVVSTEAWETMLEQARSIDAMVDQDFVAAWKNFLYLDADMPGQYTSGLAIGASGGHPVIQHFGMDDLTGTNGYSGFQSAMVRFTDDDLTIIVLSNLESVPMDTLVDVIASRLYDESLYGG